MNKKILLALSLALIAIIMASAVSAEEKVTISGIDFNIPDGYTEDVKQEIVNQTDTSSGMTSISNGKLYQNGNNTILIFVATYEGFNVTDDYIAKIKGDNLTVKNVEGKLLDFGIFKIFSYAKDGKLVTLSTDSQDELEKFII